MKQKKTRQIKTSNIKTFKSTINEIDINIVRVVRVHFHRRCKFVCEYEKKNQ